MGKKKSKLHAPKPGKCIFCGRGGMSKEHIIADWLQKLFPKHPDMTRTHGLIEQAEYNQGALSGKTTTRTKQGNAFRAKVRRVCETHCNNRWMSVLEGDLKPTLTDLVLGDSTILSPKIQAKLALWAVKTAMVAEWLCPKRACIPQEERTSLLEHFAPPMGWFVWIASHETEDWAQQMKHVAGDLPYPVGPPNAGFHKITSFSVGIGYLFVHVIWTSDKSLSFEGAGVANSALVSIHPAEIEGDVPWPGKFILTSTDADDVAARILRMGFPTE